MDGNDLSNLNYPMGSELRVMLLGKTGSGKSSLGNALLGEPEAFQASGSGSLASETSVCHKVTRLTRGRYLTVVDTPGTMDTRQPDAALRQLCQAIAMFAEGGVHAFVITLRLDVRFTKEEKMAVEMLGKLFDEKFYRFAVIAYTHGDAMDNSESRFFEAVTQARRQVPAVDSLISKCGDRITMLDNGRNRTARVQSEQAFNLVCCIDQLARSNTESAVDGHQATYTNDYFVFAQLELQRARVAMDQEEQDLLRRSEEQERRQVRDTFEQRREASMRAALDQVTNRLVEDINENKSCFPSDATVLTPLGRVRLSELTMGQPVLSLQDGRPVFSPVFMWGHRDEAVWSSDFVTVSTASAQLTLSSGHLLFVSAESAGPPDRLSAVPARGVQPGLSLQLLDGDERPRLESVVAVQRGVSRRGLLAPFTLNGCIAVDGVLASCYIDCLPHDLSHALLAPVRALWLVAPSVAAAFNRVGWRDIDGMSGWVRLACDHLLPALRRFRVKDSSELMVKGDIE